MTVETFRGLTGPLVPGPLVGRGGEGEVFALEDGVRALKVYFTPDEAREAKVRSMVAAGLFRSCPDVAFPQELAFRTDGSFAGFAMPLVRGGQAIHELYSPGSRRRHFPGADWRFLVRAAINVALVFARIHRAGAVVGDVNGSGVLVSLRAVASVIDADSFQWTIEHPCRVGVPEFTPPELQGRSLDGVPRTSDQDGFGLAVLLFHLLFLGRHPHAGVCQGRDIPLAEAIRLGQFAYSLVRRVRLKPPPFTLLLSDLPLGVRVLFERAFALRVGPRPSAADWVEALCHLERNLVACPRNDRHHHASRSRECPWCGIERANGGSVFGANGFSNAIPAARSGGSAAQIVTEGTLRRSRLDAGEGVRPRDRSSAPRPSGKAREKAADRTGASLAARARLAVALGKPADDEFSRRYIRSRDRLNGMLEEWRGRVGAWAAARSAALLADDLDRFARMERRHVSELAGWEVGERTARVRADLAGTTIAAAGIPGIGPRRLSGLLAAGIATAADVTRDALERVGGLGEPTIVALILWRDGLAAERGHRVVIGPDEASVATGAIRERHRKEVVAAERALLRAAAALEREMDDVAARARKASSEMDDALAAFAQAAADLDLLGIPVPGPSTVRAAPVVATAAQPKKAKGKKGNKAKKAGPTTVRPQNPSCPLCNGRMVKRWARGGASPNQYFLGCTNYPACSGSRALRRGRP